MQLPACFGVFAIDAACFGLSSGRSALGALLIATILIALCWRPRVLQETEVALFPLVIHVVKIVAAALVLLHVQMFLVLYIAVRFGNV